MNDYSDLIFLMGAMILFSLLTMNVSRNIVMNTQKLSSSEIEYNGIALAHSLLEKAQWATQEELDRSSGNFIFHNNGNNYDSSVCQWTKNDPCTETVQIGSGSVDYLVYIDVDDSYSAGLSGSTTDHMKVTVGVTSPYFYENFDSSSPEYPIEIEFVNAFETD